MNSSTGKNLGPKTFTSLIPFRKLFKQHPEVILVLEAETGQIIDANKAATQFYGWPLKVLRQMNIREINTLPPNLLEAEMMKAVSSGSARFEFRHRRADGSIRDVGVFTNKIAGPDKTFLYSIVHDITDRKRAEESLRQKELQLQSANKELHEQNEELLRLWDKSRQTEDALHKANQDLIRQATELEAAKRKVENDKRLLTAIMEALPIGIVITDTSGGAILANKAFETIRGEPGLEAQSVEEYFHYKAWWADTGKRVAPGEWASAIALKEGKPTIGQIIRIQRFDGTDAFVITSASPVYDTEGNIVGSALAIQDVTELKRVEQILLETQKDYVRAQEVGGIGSWRLNVRQDVLNWSDEIYRIFGLPIGTPLQYDTFLSYVHPDDRTYVNTQWQAALAGQPYDIEHRIVVAGKTKWVREKAYLEFNEKAELVSGFGIAQDITERKRAEEQLKALNNELERRVEERTRELQETQKQYLHAEKLAAIGQLSASIAHEFNNPLQAVVTILQSFKKWRTLDDKDEELLDLAISENIRMKNLIRSLQDFNRPSSGNKTLMDVHSSIDSLLLLCNADFKRKGISTALNYARQLPQILAIPDQIKQVILNLLHNAADACTRKGMITITTCSDERNIAIAIKDNGTGIEPDKMDLIFQPFYTTKPAVKGTGLGLSVCYGIIQNHQGEIHVVSKPGEGSTFTVLLPIKT